MRTSRFDMVIEGIFSLFFVIVVLLGNLFKLPWKIVKYSLYALVILLYLAIEYWVVLMVLIILISIIASFL